MFRKRGVSTLYQLLRRGSRQVLMLMLLSISSLCICCTFIILHSLILGSSPRLQELMTQAGRPPEAACSLARRLVAQQTRPPDSRYNFNVTASDLSACDRPLPDTRPPACVVGKDTVRSNLTVSVVIPFFNEALSALFRTVQSVLSRTPGDQLKEVILVDDASSYGYLRTEDFDDYWRDLRKIRLLRNKKREGLIRSRILGADIASGDVLVFLDAHVECNVGWLGPLLAEIHHDPNTIVQPFVDGIDVVTLEYSSPKQITKSGFTWDLRFVWMEIPEHQQARIRTEGDAYPAPTLVGCAFAVQRAFFYRLGALDPGLNVWGGENIELSFRAWMCGGTVLTVPCSRVGHVFKDLPYPEDVSRENAWMTNLARVSEVWMDEYRSYFQAAIAVHDAKWVSFDMDGDKTLESRKALRHQLQCQNFQWYLDNVVPEMPLPTKDAVFHGEIINKRTNACWEVMKDGHVGINFRCYRHKLIIGNFFTLTSSGLLLYRNRCVRFLFPSPSLRVGSSCPQNPTEQSEEFGVWSVRFHDDEERRWGQLHVTLRVEGQDVTWCIEQLTSSVDPHKDEQMAQTAPSCDPENEFQFWAFTYRFKYT